MSVSGPRYAFGPFQLDVGESLLLRDQQPVPLTGKAFSVLALLLERAGHLVEKQELLERLWPDAFVEEAVLSVNVAAVRRALGDDERRYIETVPRRGYRFVGEARRIDDEAQAPGPAPADLPAPLLAEPTIAESAPAEPTPPAPAGRRRVARLRWAVAAVAVLAVAVVAWRARPFGLGTPAAAVGRSVAVLPLRSLSADPDQRRFAAAMTDLLVTELGGIPALRVVSQQSSALYADSHMPLPAIARELKADAIVEGTVVREGAHVRITAQLLQASSDRQVWAASYDRDLGDTMAMQEEVAEAIARQVGVTVDPASVRTPARVAPAVYEAYLRGLYFLDEGRTDQAVAEFRSAVAADPNYGPAYTKIASAWFDRAFFGMMPPREAFPTMKEAALKAIEIDDRDAEAHAWLATEKLQYEWDWAGAEREFRRSLELNPSNSEVRHMYSHYLLTVGRRAESMAEMARAFQIDPVGLGAAT